MRQLNIVYYAYIDRQSAWKDIVSGQLRQLKEYGLFEKTKYYIHITDTSQIFLDVIHLIQEICPLATISMSVKNEFEYDALKLIYTLANERPEEIYIYLHTKGMGHHKDFRIADEIALTTQTFKDWRKNLQLFENSNINKVGLLPAIENHIRNPQSTSVGGWIWFNFWYARGSYLARCNQPVKQSNRYLFEEWLGGEQNETAVSNNDCYSLHYKSIHYFTASEAIKEFRSIKANMGLNPWGDEANFNGFIWQ